MLSVEAYSMRKNVPIAQTRLLHFGCYMDVTFVINNTNQREERRFIQVSLFRSKGL